MIGPQRRMLGVACLAAALCTGGGADAQGLFDFLFGGHRAYGPPDVPAYAPHQPPVRYERRLRRERKPVRRSSPAPAGRSATYCVRLCDGRSYPMTVDREHGADLCRRMCPASATSVFRGRNLGSAVDAGGAAYTALPNAFTYRERIVAGCTCDGKSPFGLARISPDQDPTLEKGDIVATRSALMVYDGKGADAPDSYTPIDEARLPKSTRRALAEMKVSPGGRGWYASIATPLPRPRPSTADLVGQREADRTVGLRPNT